MKIYNVGEAPAMKWWGRTWVRIRRDNGEEERVIQLRLPSWGMGYSMNTDDERWGQRMLCYLGRSGLSMRWHFPS